MVGRVHSIDTFSTLDGPGIRTVVFLQGCHLRCKYCQNPDTWNYDAPTARVYYPEEIMRLVLRSRPYFRSSGGGLTFSGGEPLLQSEFVREVFRQCRQHGIHTAVDTSLYVGKDKVLKILPYTNLFLADIKQMNKEKSLELVGASNQANLQNLQLINAHRVETWIRYVIVPGYTDAHEDITALAELIAGLESVIRVDLLPYHSLGSHKWKMLGLKYQLAQVQPPSLEQMQQLKSLLEARSGKPIFIPS